ncbi:hypothetical protein ACPPVO_54045 [Dactylosporangium sp. McL0621]|uniref:hypothetical protein n=1 Tax=Dactylosporangium sp. McL0621 TaxID=3415678 RepID=UPI003CEFE861
MPASRDPLSGLGEVPWDRLYGLDGSSSRVPSWLWTLSAADASDREEAHADLAGHICGQGRWPVSAVVVPFLVGLVDEATTPNRADLLDTLASTVLGDWDIVALPFCAETFYPQADDLTDEQEQRLIQWLYHQDGTDADEPFFWDLSGPDRWAYRAYQACAERSATVARWVSDPDDEVAARAAALLAWLPPTRWAVDALLAAEGRLVQASANLALATLHVRDRRIDERLHQCLHADDGCVAATAAVALSYRHGPNVSATVRRILADAAEPDLPQPARLAGWDDRRPPWESRALRYFASTALARAGRADLPWSLVVGFTPRTPTDKDDVNAALAGQDAIIITSHGYDGSDLIIRLETTRPMPREHALRLVARLLRGAGLPETTSVDITETGERFCLTDIP